MAKGKPEDIRKPDDKKKPRKPYKPPMGCFTKLILLIIIIVVLLLGIMAIHYNHLKGSNPELTVTDYLTFTWDKTKKTVGEYKEKALEWKEWLAKSDKTIEWLNEMFPSEGEQGETQVAENSDAEGDGETGEKAPSSGEGTHEPGTDVQPIAQVKIHPEFQAAAEEFRAGIAHFRKKENKEAYKRFMKAQDHIEAYRQVNPNDPNIEKFEEELAPYIHSAMKDSKLR